MVKNTFSQGRREGQPLVHPTSSRIGKKRDPRIAYNGGARHLNRNVAGMPTSMPSAASEVSRRNLQIHYGMDSEAAARFDSVDYSAFENAAPGMALFNTPTSVNVESDPLWISTGPSDPTLYTFPTYPLDPSYSPENKSPLERKPFSPHDISSDPSWQVPHSLSDEASTGNRIGSFESMESNETLDSVALSLNTAATSISDNYTYEAGPEFTSPEEFYNLQDFALPNGYYGAQHAADPSPPSSASPDSPIYPNMLAMDHDLMMDWYSKGNYNINNGNNVLATAPTQNGSSYRQPPPATIERQWGQDFAQTQKYEPDTVNTGLGTSSVDRGLPYRAHVPGKDNSNTVQQVQDNHYIEPLGHDRDSENGTWQLVPSHQGSSTVLSHDSPQSAGSSWAHVGSASAGSSPLQNVDRHYHVMDEMAYELEASSSKPIRGRQRVLTAQEKHDALEVRKAKACWACHLSKIKCSPCSPGRPCEQCQRLSGKRRFCWLDCFNQPLEHLLPFMTPEYIYSGYTQARTDSFVLKNVLGWGNFPISIKMNWGYRKPIEENVVILNLPEGSKLGYCDSTVANGRSKPLRTKKKSPPLGLPKGVVMADMIQRYSRLVRGIVMEDLLGYVSIAYYDQASMLPERLLCSIAKYYTSALAAGEECETLREALEAHTTLTILNKSLFIEEESLRNVEAYLGESFPAQSAARCAQRQMKLYFFQGQMRRITRVLENFSSRMWTSNKRSSKEKQWAESFAILTMLMLVIDRTLKAAYVNCETEVQRGEDARHERSRFLELVRLTETQLFERCKEIFHSFFKSRKSGKEACNPLRDGMRAFNSKKSDQGVSGLVWDLQAIIVEFGHEIRLQKSSPIENSRGEPIYMNGGRLASIFLSDFLEP